MAAITRKSKEVTGGGSPLLRWMVLLLSMGLVASLLWHQPPEFDALASWVSQPQTEANHASGTPTNQCPPQDSQQHHKQLEEKEAFPTFFEIGKKTGTDKVAGSIRFPACQADRQKCSKPELERDLCRPWSHFYDKIYDKWLKPYASPQGERIQFLEIGYYNGKGFDAYSQFLPNAELHSMEISCIAPGPRSEGKWPWGNFALKNPRYEELRQNHRLHCGDASDYGFLSSIWKEQLKRPDAPPLKVVIDDASHLATHMAASLFFWIPRIAPGGILVVEDIQPIPEANRFRTHILPQVMKDLHWCGGSKGVRDTRCFPTIQPYIAGVHCQMHICVFERNHVPAAEPDKEHSIVPEDAFTNAANCVFEE